LLEDDADNLDAVEISCAAEKLLDAVVMFFRIDTKRQIVEVPRVGSALLAASIGCHLPGFRLPQRLRR
jgi:hypothetical protein